MLIMYDDWAQELIGEYKDDSGKSYKLFKRFYDKYGGPWYYVDGPCQYFESDTKEVAERFIRETLRAVKVQ